MTHTGHGGLDKTQRFGDVLGKRPGDVSALQRFQVREQRRQGRLEHVAGGAQLAGETLQVHERRAQVVGDNVGKAADSSLASCKAVVRSATRCSSVAFSVRNASSVCLRSSISMTTATHPSGTPCASQVGVYTAVIQRGPRSGNVPVPHTGPPRLRAPARNRVRGPQRPAPRPPREWHGRQWLQAPDRARRHRVC